VIWIATVVSNVGMWIQSTAAGWLMTSLNPDPRAVAMVQVVTSLPLFLLGLPAGALADIYDRRRLLLLMEILGIVLTLVLALLISLHHVSVFSMLLLIFLAGVAYALDAPAWQAIVPQLVGHKDLAPAVALNSVGINISRAIGPALAGLTIGWWGISAPFWINGISNVGVVAALFWWREKQSQAPREFPPERFGDAIRTGLRHARYNRLLRATLLRTTGFLLFATAYWALLPLVAKDRLGGGPELYGLLLGAIGIGAIGGAFLMPRFKQRLGADGFVVAGTVGTAVTLVVFGLARQPAIAFLACLLAGLCWISVLATLNVSAQVALPKWVRGRGLATYSTVMFGAMTLGSMLWGEVASLTGLPIAHCMAAAGAVAAIPLLRRWKLESGNVIDLTPSMHWPEPVLSNDIDNDRGPVLVTTEYNIAPVDRSAFLAAIQHLAAGRKRDGAYYWGVFEDAAVSGRWIETFLVDSWLEHMRQHARVTRSDQLAEEAVARFQIEGSPKVTHFIGPEGGPFG
jgi:MFS family permease